MADSADTALRGSMRTKVLVLFILLFLLLWNSRALSAENLFNLWAGQYLLSYETVHLPQDEDMGLMGVHYLVDISPWLYTGVSAFGAVTGERGGFFTGGFEAGIRKKLTHRFSFDAGVFVGGGGGGSAPQGGGLMIRPQVGLLYTANEYSLGLHAARIAFPNGDIRSDHIALSFALPFESIRIDSDYSGDLSEAVNSMSRRSGRTIGFTRNYFSLLYQTYSPFDNVKNTDGVTNTERMDLIGFEYGRYASERSYFFAETAGAAGGSADGFAEIVVGAGYAYPLFEGGNSSKGHRLLLDTRVAAGAAGGGAVDTGGGAVYKASLGLTYQAANNFSARTQAGYVDALDGGFRAKTASVHVGYAADFAAFSKGTPENALRDEQLYAQDWGIGIIHQTYTTIDATMRANQNSDRLSLIGVKINATVDDGIYATGQALGAYDGGAGGYAVGLFGLGYQKRGIFNSPAEVFIEALVGASGGGGIAVGGGAVVQPMAGVSYDVGRNFSIEASFGKVIALKGQLNSTVVSAGLNYRFSTLNRK